jgi:hypothetical protein
MDGPGPATSGVVESSVPCVDCGYDLRGLDAGGECPECGTPVARSLTGDLLADAAPGWLRTIARGQRLVSRGTVVFVGAVVFGIISSLAIGTLGFYVRASTIAAISLVTEPVLEVASWVGLVLVLVGTLLLTAQEPRDTLLEPWTSSRSVARLGLGAAIVLGALFFVSGLRPLGLPLGLARAVTGVPLAFAVAIGGAGLLRWLARLAERIPDAVMARDARRDARRFAVLLPAAVLAGIGGQLAGRPGMFPASWARVLTISQGIFLIATMVLVLLLIAEGAAIARLMGRMRRALEEASSRARPT